MAAMIATSEQALTVSPAEGVTARFDSLACVSSRDLSRAVPAETGAPGRYLQLNGQGQVLLFPLDRDIVRVGRGLAADLHIDDSSVSRRHAIVIPHGSGSRILDDRSLNGTFVNGVRVEHVDLHGGDVITLGQFELTYLEG